MRCSRKGQRWHFASLGLRDIESIEQRFEIEAQSLNEFEAAIINTVRAWPREDVSRKNADLTARMAAAAEKSVGLRRGPSSPWLRRASFTLPPTTGSEPCALVFTSLHEASITAMSRPCSKRNLPSSNRDAGLTESDLNASVTKQLITAATQSSHFRKKDLPSERGISANVVFPTRRPRWCVTTGGSLLRKSFSSVRPSSGEVLEMLDN
jgi:hypothetical protein